MLKEIDTSIQDWTSDFISSSNNKVQLILSASITPLELSKYISSLANDSGGYILVGAYSKDGYGSGIENVNNNLIDNSLQLLKGVEPQISQHKVRLQNIYLLKIEKSDSLAFADDSPYILKNGKPSIISERQIIEKLGLGVDSSFRARAYFVKNVNQKEVLL
ncbi:putative DNA binding domain-containing protein [Pseudoalteromonas sp. B131b]|uniref:AlbA family DNA-binding domain-containing protein n=1 Tax=Pseudoalteromonas sp. B131b TaxID=630493 RepID=UPI00301DEE0C